MTRFLHVVPPLTGHLLPHLAVASELLARGHEVAVAAPPQCASIVRASGSRHVPLRRLENDAGGLERHNRGDTPLWKVPAWYFSRYVSPEWFLAEVADVSAAVERFEPDLLIYDQWTAGSALVVPELFRLPSAVLAIMLFSTRSPDASLALGRIAPSWPAAGSLASLAEVQFWRSCMSAVEQLQLGHASRFRTHHGLAPLGSTTHELYDRHALYLHSGVPALDRALEDLSPNHSYVGPCQWHEAISDETAHRVASVLGKGNREIPLIVVSLGTVHAHGGVRQRFLERCVQALAGLPVRAIITTGAGAGEGGTAGERPTRPPLPPNVTVERWLPHGPLVEQASAMITNGGAGTVGQALRRGIPLVVIPFHSDQPENALRLQQRGLGLKLPMLSSPHRIRSALLEVLRDPAYGRNAERMATIVRTHGGAARAATLLANVTSRAVVGDAGAGASRAIR